MLGRGSNPPNDSAPLPALHTPMEIGGANLAGAAMRASPNDEYHEVTLSVLVPKVT